MRQELVEHLSDVVWTMPSSHYNTQKLNLKRVASFPSNEYL